MAAPGAPRGSVLKDVVAYVEVWSANGTENYSKTFTNQLVEMGAKVSKTFNKQVTHVVFKDGYQRTWDKARERGVKLVSVLWVERCRTAGARVDEALFPAASRWEHFPCPVRKHKCMQPKDFIPKTPENDKRLQKKFEKMAHELQRQRTTLDNDSPALLFESNGSLTYSPTVKMYSGHHSAMEKRLQEMKEKRENLSPTSSQMLEQSLDSPVHSSSAVSLQISQDASGSDGSFAGALHLASEDLCGNSGCPRQGRKSGRFVDGIERDMFGSSKASDSQSSALPGYLHQGVPQPSGSPASEEPGGQRGPAGGTTAPAQKQAEGGSGTPDGKCGLSAASPVTEVCSPGQSHTRRSLAKRKRMPGHLGSPLVGRPKRARCRRQAAVPRARLFPTECGRQPAAGTLDGEGSPYDDYFSLDNLKERSSENPPPGCQASASPAELSGLASLSKRERTSILETSDFSWIGKDRRPADISTASADSSSLLRLRRPADDESGTPPGAVAPEKTPAAGRGREAGARHGEDGAPGGTPSTCTDRELTRRTEQAGKGQHGDSAPTEGSRTGPEDPVDERSAQEEERSPRTPSSLAGAEDGLARPSALEGSREGCQGLVRPEKPQRRGRGPKPARTLVMTSMPPEQQSIVLRVVEKLKGFAVAREVCEDTTHVLAGEALRTLNVLLGLARGCWILSYEWVLWSLELGHWISEEPFELSRSFPAAPLCRQERLLSAGPYQGTLFAGQATMFISPASDPPRAKLRELIQLCGGRVTAVLRQAGIFIGPCHGKKKAAVTYLSERWILDSITKHKICACENYLLLR